MCEENVAAMVLGLCLGMVGGGIYLMWRRRMTARETNTHNQGNDIELETIEGGQTRDE